MADQWSRFHNRTDRAAYLLFLQEKNAFLLVLAFAFFGGKCFMALIDYSE